MGCARALLGGCRLFVASAVGSACGLEEALKTGELGFALAGDAKTPERTAGSTIFIERGRGYEGLSMANLGRDSHSSPPLQQGASPEQPS